MGLSADPWTIHHNANSGAQALNLAINWGAREVHLVGFDMQGPPGQDHWFGEHPKPLRMPQQFSTMIERFQRVAQDCKARGVRVINTNPESALRCFEFGEL